MESQSTEGISTGVLYGVTKYRGYKYRGTVWSHKVQRV